MFLTLRYYLNRNIKTRYRSHLQAERIKTKNYLDEEITELKKSLDEKFIKDFTLRTEFAHNINHASRNLAVKLMPVKKIVKWDDKGPIMALVRSHYRHEGDLKDVLNNLVALFKCMQPTGVNVWACIRERKTDDCYYTFIRSSNSNPSRDLHSTKINKDAKNILALKAKYAGKDKTCVLITGSEDTNWEKTENDSLGEDQSVMMGAVMSKSWNENINDFDDPMLNWILFVNADRKNAFNSSQIELMKSFNDIISWLLNSFIRVETN